MGKRKTALIFFLIIICLVCITCTANKIKTNKDYITEWVKRTYGSASSVTITSTVDSSLTDRTVYSGNIVIGDKKLDGLFFYYPKNHAVDFTEIK